MQIAPGYIIGGKYRLDKPLSRGGMGAVWIARHAQLGSPLAIKFMDPAFVESPAFVARFEREGRIAANLQSPHVVHVQDYGIVDGVPYIVMELLQGEDLNARLRRVGRLPLQDAVHILTQVGRAIRRAHEAGVVHRDLKPGNLFLAVVEDYEVVKVLDFGIVKESSSQQTGELTATGDVLGSPPYMSPEQVRGSKDLDHRSDLWSLGVILYRMITGQLPFSGELLMVKILIDPVPQATQLAPELPPAIDDFFAKAFARDRSQRFQSVREMIDELSRIADIPTRDAFSSGPDPVVGWKGPMVASTMGPATMPLAAADAGVHPAGGAVAHAPSPVERRASDPAAIGPSAASGTITSASLGGIGGSDLKKRSRTVLPVAIGVAVLLLGVGVAMTALRLRSADAVRSVIATPAGIPTGPTVQAAGSLSSTKPVVSVAASSGGSVAHDEPPLGSAQSAAPDMPPSVQPAPSIAGAASVVPVRARSAQAEPAAAKVSPTEAKVLGSNPHNASTQPKPRRTARDPWLGD